MEFQIAQDDAEISALVDLLKRENVRSFLEVGSKFGGSLWRIASALPEGSRVVSVDLPNGTKSWTASRKSLASCIDKLKDMNYDARVIWGNSTDPAVISQVSTLGPFDAILIDADHRLSGVTKDWKNYGPLGKMVAFHDIGWRRAPEWEGVRIDVPEFWDSIKGDFRHEEFKLCPTGKNNGIGVLWREDRVHQC